MTEQTANGETMDPAAHGDPPEEVVKLLWYHRLHQAGVITDAEFTRVKRAIIEATPTSTTSSSGSSPEGQS